VAAQGAIGLQAEQEQGAQGEHNAVHPRHARVRTNGRGGPQTVKAFRDAKRSGKINDWLNSLETMTTIVQNQSSYIRLGTSIPNKYRPFLRISAVA